MQTKTKEKLVVFRVNGRLGNQLFQYACALEVATRLGARLLLDPKCERVQVLGQYFNLEYASEETVRRLAGTTSFSGKLYRRLQRFLPARHRNFVLESSQRFQASVFRIQRSCLLEGYWQSHKYFPSLGPERFSALTIRIGLEAQGDTLANLAGESVVVHVRGTDAIQAYGGLNAEYYRNAVTAFGPTCKFLVISDDMPFARTVLSGIPNVQFAGENRTKEMDLNLMIHAAGLVIANSTFSWWGAYLNPKAEVVAPKQWHVRNKNLPPVSSDLYPAHWTVL